jgi:hypothetical protein
LAALVAVCWTAPAAAAIDDQPPDLIASSTTLAKVRALYQRSNAPIPRNATTIEIWKLQQDGQTGTQRDWLIGKDERSETVLGPLVSQAGIYNGAHWQQNRNGITFTYAGFHQRDDVDERTWESRNVRDVRLVGESVPENAYVVELSPPGGRLEWLFIDKRDGQIVRRERVERRRRFVTTYQDFKPFDGELLPDRVRTVDSFGNERELTLISRTLDTTPDPRDVEIPASRRQFVEFPAGASTVRLPVRFVNGLLVARVACGPHVYEFLLDSGAAGIVIDPLVAETLNLERYGSHVGSALGPFAEETSIVPVMTFGSLRMRNVVSRVVPVPLRADERTRIAGLMGFDFFADTVVHIDPERGIVEALPHQAFRPPPETAPLALALDDKQPAIRTRVGSVAARVILDTGANRTVFTPDFARRADLAIDRDDPAASPLHGVGGTGSAESVRLNTIEFDGMILDDRIADVSTADFGVEDIDGILGTDITRDFDLYLDYRANAAYARRLRRVQ